MTLIQFLGKDGSRIAVNMDNISHFVHRDARVELHLKQSMDDVFRFIELDAEWDSIIEIMSNLD